MAQVGVVKTTWTGTTGGPGLTQTVVTNPTGDPISATQATQAGAAVRKFWAAIASAVPNEVTLQVLPTMDCFEVGAFNNSLASSLTMTASPAVVTGTDTGSYNMAGGLKINLDTGVIRFGRRVRGCWYVVPAGQGVYTNSGTIMPTMKTTIETAGATLVTEMNTAGLNLGVWTRFNKVKHPDRTSFVAFVSRISVNDKTAVLRGRRD